MEGINTPVSTATSQNSLAAYDPSMQVCPSCSMRKSLDDFAVVRFGIGTQCKECHKEEKLASKIERLQAIATKTAIADLANIARQKIDSPHISQMCESLVKQFGGVEAFSNFYYCQIQAAAADKPGSKAVLDACKSVVGLINQSTEHRKTAPDVVDLSDAELEREKAKMIIELLIRDGSGEALAILREMDGYDGRLPGETPGTIEANPSGADTAGERPAIPVRADGAPESVL